MYSLHIKNFVFTCLSANKTKLFMLISADYYSIDLIAMHGIFEIKRWVCKTYCTINHECAVSGDFSLKVFLTAADYSGVLLKYFSHDWAQFSRLHFSIFNTSLEPLLIHCRTHDLPHLENNYSDRFITRFTLNHGWNNIEISLEDVANAPSCIFRCRFT